MTTDDVTPGVAPTVKLRPPETTAADELQAELRRLSAHELRLLRDCARRLRRDGADFYARLSRTVTFGGEAA